MIRVNISTFNCMTELDLFADFKVMRQSQISLEEFASSRGVSDVMDEEERLLDPRASVIIATTSLIVGLLAGELLVQNSAIFRTRDIS